MKSSAVGAGVGVATGLALLQGVAIPSFNVGGYDIRPMPVVAGAVGAWIGGWKGAALAFGAAMVAQLITQTVGRARR